MAHLHCQIVTRKMCRHCAQMTRNNLKDYLDEYYIQRLVIILEIFKLQHRKLKNRLNLKLSTHWRHDSFSNQEISH